MEWLLKRGAKIDIEWENDLSVRDVFFEKNWSYAEHYDKLVEEVKKKAKYLKEKQIFQVQVVKDKF